MAETYEVGDFVTFNESYEIDPTCSELFEVFDEWKDNQITSIDNGWYEFEDFDGKWRIGVIRGMSDDQRDSN